MNTLASQRGEFYHDMLSSLTRYIDEKVEEKVKHQLKVMSEVNEDSVRVDELEEENCDLKNTVRVLEGRLTRAERELSELQENLLKQQAKSMEDNLKFFNIPEERKEDCEVTLRKFLTDEMKINSADMDKIKFDRVHRVGGGGSMRHRPIVAKFNPYLVKVIVLNHIPKLDKNKGYGINDQLPRELEERKKQLLPDYRKAKLNQQKVKWSMDKLIIDGEVTVAKRDKVTNINSDTTEQAIRLQQDT